MRRACSDDAGEAGLLHGSISQRLRCVQRHLVPGHAHLFVAWPLYVVRRSLMEKSMDAALYAATREQQEEKGDIYIKGSKRFLQLL